MDMFSVTLVRGTSLSEKGNWANKFFFIKIALLSYQHKVVEVHSLMILSLDSKNDKVSVTVRNE